MTHDTRQSHMMAGTLICLMAAGALSIVESVAALAAGDNEGHYSQAAMPNSYTDWTSGIVVARGVASPPNMTGTDSPLKEATRAAARIAAQRNLLQALNGLYVDATQTIGSYLAAKPDLRAQVEGLVRNALVVQEFQLRDGSIEVMVEMAIGGELSELLVAHPAPSRYTHAMEQ